VNPSDTQTAESVRPRPNAFGLALKITLPFVALFALLLSVLGFLLARNIISDIEERVEREQRFVLNMLGRFPVNTDMADAIHGIETQSFARESPDSHTFFVLFLTDPNGRESRTVVPDDADGRAMLEGLIKLRSHPEFQADKGGFRRQSATLSGQNWQLLFRSYLDFSSRRDAYHIYPADEIEQEKSRAISHIVKLGCAGLLCVALLGLLVAYWVALPVRRLATAARRITTAGLAASTPGTLALEQAGRARDEIGELALAFKTMLESLRRSQQELLKNERLASTGKLAASVAHEIRNPLTSMRMTIEIMQQRAQKSADADPSTREGYAIVLREIDRLALAVDELLTFARPRPPKREPMDVNGLAGDVLKFMEHQLTHARVSARLEADPAMPPHVSLDPNKIRQLLVNLILNAQQAIVRDGAITVRTQWDAANKRVALAVADTGPGIPEEIRANVFDLFVSTKDGGGGIGLAIARQIAEEHGGSIAFETSSKGTTFNIVLSVL